LVDIWQNQIWWFSDIYFRFHITINIYFVFFIEQIPSTDQRFSSSETEIQFFVSWVLYFLLIFIFFKIVRHHIWQIFICNLPKIEIFFYYFWIVHESTYNRMSFHRLSFMIFWVIFFFNDLYWRQWNAYLSVSFLLSLNEMDILNWIFRSNPR
jgi:hypothetical protein